MVHYFLNKEYYVTVLCENMDKPELHCEGKCHIEKTLQINQEEKGEQTVPPLSEISIENLFIVNISSFDLNLTIEKTSHHSLYKIGEYPDQYFSHFHPPEIQES